MPNVLDPADAIPREALQRCDGIAVQHTALMQAHAALLVADARTGEVLQASTNLEEIVGLEVAATLGTGLDALWPALGLSTAPQVTAEPRVLEGLRSASGVALTGRVHRAEALLLLELEPATSADDLHLEAPHALALACARAADAATHPHGLAAAVTQQLQEATGYDRCLVYRFDAAWHGEVIGEARSALATDHYLGLRFPASDVPASARAMLLRTPVRATVDVQRPCAQVVPQINPTTCLPLDLSEVRGRGSAHSCRTFYGNLGVRSTLVLPLLVDGLLWGMISCHGARPLRPLAQTEAAFELIARSTANALSRLGLKRRLRAERNVARLFQEDLEVAASASAEFDALAMRLLSLIPSDGFMLRTSGGLLARGTVPADHEASALVDQLLAQSHGGFLISNRLGAAAAGVAGALLVRLSSGVGDAAVWLRHERAQTVQWAGAPSQGLTVGAGGPELRPRSSFAPWQETTQGASECWSQEELELARAASLQLGLKAVRWARPREG